MPNQFVFSRGIFNFVKYLIVLLTYSAYAGNRFTTRTHGL